MISSGLITRMEADSCMEVIGAFPRLITRFPMFFYSEEGKE